MMPPQIELPQLSLARLSQSVLREPPFGVHLAFVTVFDRGA